MSSPRLNPEIAAFLRLGLSIHVGACSADGMPQLTRALAVRIREDQQVEILVPSVAGAALLAAVRESGHLAAVFCQPTTHRTLQLKGRVARVDATQAGQWPQLPVARDAFTAEVEPYGFDASFCDAWFGVEDDGLHALAFLPTGAWNQTPGPAAGAPMPVHDA